MLPWGEMLRAALAAGIPPDAFWRLGLREWRWIAAVPGTPARDELETLMTRFPDRME